LGCSVISWTICKQSAPRCRQTTTPTPHHSMFTGWMLFLMPSQQRQSTEGHTCASTLVLKYTNDIKSVRIHDADRCTTGWTRRFAYSFNQSNAPHRLLPTQPPCCARRPSDVIRWTAQAPLGCAHLHSSPNPLLAWAKFLFLGLGLTLPSPSSVLSP